MFSIIPVQAHAVQLPVKEQQTIERQPRLAMGILSFNGSTKDRVKLHGFGFDTGDISTITGLVPITVGTITKSYNFSGIVPGLYDKDIVKHYFHYAFDLMFSGVYPATYPYYDSKLL